jgi:hypothetical protein
MFHNILVFAVLIVVAFVTTIVLSLLFHRQKKWPTFRGWWDAEGIVVFMLALLSLVILALTKDWLHNF